MTVPVGKVPEATTTLLRVTRESLDLAIAVVKVGARLSNVGHAVQDWVEKHGFSIVREFVGHGIGERPHEEPQIPNYGPAGRGLDFWRRGWCWPLNRWSPRQAADQGAW